jgi:hypothetical protein
MREFKLEIGFAFGGGVVESGIEMFAEDKLDLLKKVRRRFSEYCYSNTELVEWIEGSDDWNKQVNDEFLLELIIDVDDTTFNLALAEGVYFECSEIS